MGSSTEIAWTDSTFNPWWGCTRVDPACLHCYAEAFDHRYGGSHWGPNAPRRTFSEKHWAEPRKWDHEAAKAGTRRRVFCASMADWADVAAPVGSVGRLFDLIRQTQSLDWLLLTKRSERIAELLPADWGDGWSNVWLGVTVGDQAGTRRLDDLSQIPAVVRFCSMEPLLEPVRLSDAALRSLDWVIVGGESGGRARPMELDWARQLRDQAKNAGGAFFMKQIGGPPGLKRDQMQDFPADLQIRDFPVPRHVIAPWKTSAV